MLPGIFQARFYAGMYMRNVQFTMRANSMHERLTRQ